MFYRVKDVQPLPNYNLAVRFENGRCKRYDVRPLFSRWEPFQALASVRGLFEQVRVDERGYGISWNDEIDLSCNELYENGVDVNG